MDPKDFKSYAQTEQTFMQRVYQWMAAGLAVTGAVAYWAAGTPAVLRAMAGGGFIVAMIVELVLVIWLSRSIMTLSPQTALTGFLVYSAINGLTLCFIFAVYTGASIAATFFVTAASFAGVSLFGWVTKSDLSSLGGYLAMALIGIIVGGLVNLFLQAPALYWVLTYAGLAVFIGLTAYDTQQLKLIHQNQGEAGEQVAILGALRLYLDFINLFLLLLRLFGRRRD